MSLTRGISAYEEKKLETIIEPYVKIRCMRCKKYEKISSRSANCHFNNYQKYLCKDCNLRYKQNVLNEEQSRKQD